MGYIENYSRYRLYSSELIVENLFLKLFFLLYIISMQKYHDFVVVQVIQTCMGTLLRNSFKNFDFFCYFKAIFKYVCMDRYTYRRETFVTAV